MANSVDGTVDEATCARAIADLRAAIGASAWPAALAHALAAWRAWPSPALADLVDALATRCAPPVPPAVPRDLPGWWIEHAAYDPVAATALAATATREVRGSPGWLAIRARYPVGHPILGPLVLAYGESFGESAPSHLHLVDRLAAMAAWPADPRAAAPLCRWLVTGEVGWEFDQAPYGDAARVLYELIARELHRIGDARALPALVACASAPAGATAALRAVQGALATELVAALAAEPALPPPLEAAVAACAAEVPPLPGAGACPDAALWAEIAAHPTDDAPRLVLADALIERGDPRGTLIVLQCAAGADTRPDAGAAARALIDAHWPDLVGELAPLLVRAGCVFRRGLLDTITVGQRDTPAGSYAGLGAYRELACVTTVRPAAITSAQYVRVLGAFERLDVVDLALPLALRALELEQRPWRFRIVELREAAPPLHDRDPAAVIAALLGVVPALEELRVEANLWTDPALRVAYLDALAARAPGVRVTMRAGTGFAARRSAGEDRLATVRGRTGLALIEA